MVLRIAGISLLALTGLHAEPTAVGKPVAASIKLTDPNGKSVNPLANEGQRATVLIFLTTDCPLCNTYAPEIGRIVADYKEAGVRVYGVYAGESVKEISRHLKDYKLPLTALLDPTLQLATLTGATVTPEACVLNAGGEVMYRGRIDDRAVKLGTVRAEPKQRDLRLAIEAVLLKKPVPEKFTKAIGCYLPHPQLHEIQMNAARLSRPLLAILLTSVAKAETNFSEHIAPIVFNNCASCHREGQIAPFSLTDFASVKKRAKQIVEVTGDRTMPPWHADHGFVEYSNDRSLTKEQIALIADWVKAGTPEGDASKLPQLPTIQDGWQLGKPSQIATMTEPFTVPAEGKDIYRKFVIPLNLDKDTWVSGIEFHPGDPKVVHHILYYLDTTGKAREYDAKDPGPGFKGMASSAAEFRYIGGWDLGSQPSQLPYGLRWFIPKGADLVVQIHYHPSGKETTDQSSVGLHYSEQPTSRPWTIIPVPPQFGMLQGIDIPAGAKEYVQKATFIVPADCEAFAVNAHAHYLGKRMEMTATLPDGTNRWLLKTSNWDFKWQEDYAFKHPIKLPAGTKLDVTLSYDNSADNPNNPTNPPKRVLWGPSTTDEMGVITLCAMFDTKEQKESTHQALKTFLANQLIDRLLEGNVAMAGIVGQGKTGKRSPEQALQAARIPLLALDTDKDGKLNESERGPALTFILQGAFIKQLGAIGFD